MADRDSNAPPPIQPPDNLAASDVEPIPPDSTARSLQTMPPGKEDLAPMLEAHAPHEAIHNWKDFTIHIVAIVVGLLIAVGLEQTVEFFHDRHEVAQTREALRLEREQNRNDLARWAIAIRREQASLNNNLLVLSYLKLHPGTAQALLPGILTWHSATSNLTTAAWSTAQQTLVTGLMPASEVRALARFYRHISLIEKSNDDYWRALNEARLYAFRDPDLSHLSPAQIDQAIDGTLRALESLYLEGVTIVNVNDDFPGFVAGLNPADINSMPHVTDTESNSSLAAPIAETIQRIDAAGKQKDFFPQAPPAG